MKNWVRNTADMEEHELSYKVPKHDLCACACVCVCVAGSLHTVLQSLRRLSVSEQVTDSWERP